jgi:hypothetical protein
MTIRIVAKKYNPAKQAELYFGVDETNFAFRLSLERKVSINRCPRLQLWGGVDLWIGQSRRHRWN